jgi:DNA-binding Xre family transcriptional regulator
MRRKSPWVQLAHLAGISKCRIEQVGGGIATTTTPDTARALASALGCPVNDLVEVVDGEG